MKTKLRLRFWASGVLAVAAALSGTRYAQAATVGYYDMYVGGGTASQVAPIQTAGGTPVSVTSLSAAELSSLDVLFVQNPSNDYYGYYAGEYLSHLTEIQSAVQAGMVLIVHDRYVTSAASILPGGGGITFVSFYGPSIDVLTGGTLVTSGPGGIVNNATLDGGNYSTHGYATSASLVAGAVKILTTGDASQIVTFAYPYGAGWVIYSAIPLDHYLSGNPPAAFGAIYAPNVVAYGISLALPRPEISVEQPAGMALTDGVSSLDFGSVNLGESSAMKTFVVTNSGVATLTGLAITTNGVNAADFVVGALGATAVAPGASTTFAVTFSPVGIGARSMAIHIASNDSDENPFDIALTGIGLNVPVSANIDVHGGQYAWSSHTGWQNYRPTHGGVIVVPYDGVNGYLTGYAWAENTGWIKLGSGTGPYANTTAANWGVNMDASGNLFGYAWSSQAGWINFHPTHGQVTINTTTGKFDGFAWGENIGWIHFQNASPAYNVRTTAFDPAPQPIQGTIFMIK